MKTKKGLAVSLSALLFVIFICGKNGKGFKCESQGNNPLEGKVNDSDFRIKSFPIAMQSYTFRKFSFFETIEKTKDLGIKYLQAYPGQVLNMDDPNVKLDHKMDDEQIVLVRNVLEKAGVELIAYGVVNIGRTEESMRHVFNFAKKMGIHIIVTEPEDDDYALLEQLIGEYNLQVAIHNHPEPSKYARPEVVLARVKDRDGRIGACADPGHWMRTGLNPVDSLRLLSGQILDVHLKDRSDFGTDGVIDVPFGQGKADIRAILAELTRQDYSGFLTVEYENEEEAGNPVPAVRKSINYIKSITCCDGYEEILRRIRGRYTKHGWNHYGPGSFEIDEKEGILRSRGGMGLFWYSAKKYGDFILELQYMCPDQSTNSGIFLRVPDVPVNDDYIYHSFEVQINDSGEGIHKSGAVYDAEPPRTDAAKKTGEWNHLKITFKGNHLEIELNGVKVVDWEAEPRGKIRDFASEGYIGLQNHDIHSSVYFRNIFVKEI